MNDLNPVKMALPRSPAKIAMSSGTTMPVSAAQSD
jgi:hypothetical protein